MPPSRNGISPRLCPSARWPKVRRLVADLRSLPGARHPRLRGPKARRARKPREKVRGSTLSHRKGDKSATRTIRSGNAVTAPVAGYMSARHVSDRTPSTCTRPSSRSIFLPRARGVRSPQRALDKLPGGWPSSTCFREQVIRPASDKAWKGYAIKRRFSCTWKSGTFWSYSPVTLLIRRSLKRC